MTACYALYGLSAVPFVLAWLLIDCLFHGTPAMYVVGFPNDEKEV